jgi:hypothetical protein
MMVVQVPTETRTNQALVPASGVCELCERKCYPEFKHSSNLFIYQFEMKMEGTSYWWKKHNNALIC